MRTRTPISIVNLSQEQVVCERAFIADRPLARMRGLLGRSDLPTGEGLLLRPAPAIHTMFMRFAIDVLFLDPYFKVIKIVDSLPPWHSVGARDARTVVELAAGEASRRGVRLGDRLDVQPVRLPDSAAALASTVGTAGAAHDSSSLLLVSEDRRFRSVTAALLTRRGWKVTVVDRREEVEAMADQCSPQVAVVDATASLTATAELVAKLKARRHAAGVVVVSGSSHAGFTGLPVHQKWGSFESLCSAIDQAGTGPGEAERGLADPAAGEGAPRV